MSFLKNMFGKPEANESVSNLKKTSLLIRIQIPKQKSQSKTFTTEQNT